MFCQSRFANMAFAFSLLITGALTAYTRCFEKSASPLHDHAIEIGGAVEGVAETEFVHCNDFIEPSAFVRSTKQTQRLSADEEPVNRIESVLKTNNDSCTRENLASPAMFRYGLVPLYQFTVVYRI